MPISARGKLRQEQALSCPEKSRPAWLWQGPRNPDPGLSAAASCPSCPTQGRLEGNPLLWPERGGGWQKADQDWTEPRHFSPLRAGDPHEDGEAGSGAGGCSRSWAPWCPRSQREGPGETWSPPASRGLSGLPSPLASPRSPTHWAARRLLADSGVQLLLPDLAPRALAHQPAGLGDLGHFWAPQLRCDPPTQSSSRTPGPKTWGGKAIATDRCPPVGHEPGEWAGHPDPPLWHCPGRPGGVGR